MKTIAQTDSPEIAPQSADPLDHLADALFHKMGTDGVYARTALYEDMVERLAALITRHREPDTEIMRFPPVMNRGQLEKSGYLKSFPNLLGCVCGLHGTEREIHRPSAASMPAATGPRRSLPPISCCRRRPAIRSTRLPPARGPLPTGGLRFDVAADCFRAEPSRHLDRLQSFRMREYVCIGSPDDVSDFRERWMVRAQAIARDLGLTFKVDYASDPFFGRVGQMKAVSQKQQSLKFELLVPLRSEEQPTACMSFNYHRDHFGTTWGITDANGEPAHTGCVAFGMDRLAVAMFHTHGTDTAKWPVKLRQMLGFAP